MFDKLVINYEASAVIGAGAWLLANYLTDQGEVFSWWRLYVLDRLPERIAKPLGLCAMCTAGFWSLIFNLVHTVPLLFISKGGFFYVANVAASCIFAMGVAIALTKHYPNE